MATRKIPPYEDFVIEYNKVKENFKEDADRKAVECLSKKYNCCSKTIRRAIKIVEHENTGIPKLWLKGFSEEWNAITNRIISGKHTVITKQFNWKVIPAADIPRGYIYIKEREQIVFGALQLVYWKEKREQ